MSVYFTSLTDALTAEFAQLPLIPAYFQTQQLGLTNGVNFASAGAGSLVETFSGFVRHLSMFHTLL